MPDLLLLLVYFILVGSPIALLAWLITSAWERWANPIDNDSER